MIEMNMKLESTTPQLEQAWLRIFENKQARFFELPSRSELWSISLNRALDIEKQFKKTCLVGIGGSSLGARALHAAFGNSKHHEVYFAESPDEIMIGKLRDQLGDLGDVHFVFISKSGKTLETLSLLDYFHQLCDQELKISLASRSTVVTGAGASPLRQWATQNNVPILPVPEDVGGRFSVLSPVGLLPAALMGVPLDRMRAGAEWALSQKILVLNLASLSIESWKNERWITQMWMYSGSLQTLGLWWQQLWSESLGKRQDRNHKPAPRASTPMVSVGPQDQHSLLQQLQEAERDKLVIVLRDLALESRGLAFSPATLQGLDSSLKSLRLSDVLDAELHGFIGALEEGQIPHVVMQMSSANPEHWGAFFMVWMLVIAVLGELLNIDAFDQPGVELGKRLALKALTRTSSQKI